MVGAIERLTAQPETNLTKYGASRLDDTLLQARVDRNGQRRASTIPGARHLSDGSYLDRASRAASSI